MTDPDDREVADALRRTFADQAREAPDGSELAERIIAEVDTGATVHRFPGRSRAGRVLPLVAAAAVIGLIVGLVAAIRSAETGPDRRDAARPPTSTQTAPSTVAPSPARSTSSASSASSPPRTSAAPSSNLSSAHAILPDSVKHVAIVDATFTSQTTGWALASADCLRTTGRCTALLRSTDGMRWKSHPNTPFNVPGVSGCAAPCVRGIRFATDDVGYAFGPGAFFMTTDGAQSWKRLSGGADTVETLAGNVIRVERAPAVTVSLADVGSRTWRPVRLPGRVGAPDSVALSRTGDAAYLLAEGANGSTLWTSGTDGRRWTNRGDVCTGAAQAALLTTATDGSVAVLCRADAGNSVAVSQDGGRSFRAGPRVLGAATVRTIGASSADTILVSSDTTYRSTSGGQRFRRLDQNAGSSPGAVSYIGFSSGAVAHAISRDGASIYVSVDAGRTWRQSRFD